MSTLVICHCEGSSTVPQSETINQLSKRFSKIPGMVLFVFLLPPYTRSGSHQHPQRLPFSGHICCLERWEPQSLEAFQWQSSLQSQWKCHLLLSPPSLRQCQIGIGVFFLTRDVPILANKVWTTVRQTNRTISREVYPLLGKYILE